MNLLLHIAHHTSTLIYISISLSISLSLSLSLSLINLVDRYISHEVRTPLNTIQLALDIITSEMSAAIAKLSSQLRKRTDTLQNNETADQNQRSSSKKKEENLLTTTTKTNTTTPSPPPTTTTTTEEGLVLQMQEWLQWLSEVEESSQSAVFVFNDLLNYDKITNGVLDVEYSVLSPLDFINTAIHPFFVQAKQGDIELNVVIEERLRQNNEEEKVTGDLEKFSGRSACVLGDGIKLGQVVKNLISNALKFTTAGGKITVQVSWVEENIIRPTKNSFFLQSCCVHYLSRRLRSAREVHEPAGTLLVSVTDSGAGLSNDNLKYLFKEGVQFNVNQLQAGGGSGLGLWISKGVVDLHAGVLSASSDGIGKEGILFSDAV